MCDASQRKTRQYSSIFTPPSARGASCAPHLGAVSLHSAQPHPSSCLASSHQQPSSCELVTPMSNEPQGRLAKPTSARRSRTLTSIHTRTRIHICIKSEHSFSAAIFYCCCILCPHRNQHNHAHMHIPCAGLARTYGTESCVQCICKEKHFLVCQTRGSSISYIGSDQFHCPLLPPAPQRLRCHTQRVKCHTAPLNLPLPPET